jgi:hypothetical protein
MLIPYFLSEDRPTKNQPVHEGRAGFYEGTVFAVRHQLLKTDDFSSSLIAAQKIQQRNR